MKSSVAPGLHYWQESASRGAQTSHPCRTADASGIGSMAAYSTLLAYVAKAKHEHNPDVIDDI